MDTKMKTCVLQKIIIFILFAFVTTKEVIALRVLAAAPAIPAVANITFGVNNANAPLGIQAWENATFQNTANEVFNTGLVQPPANAPQLENDYSAVMNTVQNIAAAIGGTANFTTMVNAMSNRSNAGNDVPHVAVIRVVILDSAAPNPNAYVYPIPYLFLSGNDYMGAYDRWTRHTTQQNIQRIDTADNNRFANICVVINDYGIDGGQNYCHSERAIGLCLDTQFNDPFHLQNIVNYHNATYNAAANQANSVIIQIKTSLAICPGCQNFWMGEAWILGNSFCGQHAGGGQYDVFASLQGAIQNVSLRVRRRHAGQILGR
jgi:hypothetical protein